MVTLLSKVLIPSGVLVIEASALEGTTPFHRLTRGTSASDSRFMDELELGELSTPTMDGLPNSC